MKALAIILLGFGMAWAFFCLSSFCAGRVLQVSSIHTLYPFGAPYRIFGSHLPERKDMIRRKTMPWLSLFSVLVSFHNR